MSICNDEPKLKKEPEHSVDLKRATWCVMHFFADGLALNRIERLEAEVEAKDAQAAKQSITEENRKESPRILTLTLTLIGGES